MSCKIRVEHNNKEAGKRSYYMMTQDAASLEARICTADTALNKDGIDPVLAEVYRPGSEYGEDLHSITSFNTFAKYINLEINEVLDEDSGKTFLVLDNQSIKIKRDNKEITVLGKDLLETDSIIDYID